MTAGAATTVVVPATAAIACRSVAQVVRSGAGTRGGKHGRNAADLSLRLGALEGCERGNNVAGLQPQQVRHDTPGAAGAAIGDRVVVPLLHPGRRPGG